MERNQTHLTEIKNMFTGKINRSNEVFSNHLQEVQQENEKLAKEKEEQRFEKFENFVIFIFII